MRLGCAPCGRGEADALFEVRQEAMRAKGIRTEEAPRLYVAGDLNYLQPSQEPHAAGSAAAKGGGY